MLLYDCRLFGGCVLFGVAVFGCVIVCVDMLVCGCVGVLCLECCCALDV